jgi:hypothetical protein
LYVYSAKIVKTIRYCFSACIFYCEKQVGV